MGSVKMPKPPPAPTPVDPGKSSLDFIKAMADPALQRQLLQAEQTYRPEYTELELADINTLLRGTEDQAGLLALQDEAAESVSGTEQRLTAAQRLADIEDVETLGGRATEALRSADPLQQALVQQLNEMAQDQLARSGRLTPEQMRNAQQQARLGGAARGRVGDQATVASEILNREQQLRNRRAEALEIANSAFRANKATSADPFQAILGRPASAPGMGMASSQFAAGLAGEQLGPNLFDPNAGINLGLQNQANLANYRSNIYGSQAGFAGAKAQARGSMIGGLAGGLGALGGGLLSNPNIF
jgi:hypothetical protein